MFQSRNFISTGRTEEKGKGVEREPVGLIILLSIVEQDQLDRLFRVTTFCLLSRTGARQPLIYSPVALGQPFSPLSEARLMACRKLAWLLVLGR